MNKQHNRTPKELDKLLGKIIRKYRYVRGLTQQQLAERIGVRFQQVQKYEEGGNRCSFSRLIAIADALETHPSELLEAVYDHGDAVPIEFDVETRNIFKAFSRMSVTERKRFYLSRRLFWKGGSHERLESSN